MAQTRPDSGETQAGGGFPVVHQQHVERRRKARVNPKIRVPALNITSFLDMSFCLLTFLILVAGFSAGEGSLTANLPAGEGPAVEGQTPVDMLKGRPLFIILSSTGGGNCHILIEGLSSVPPSFTSLGDTLAQLRYDKERNPGGALSDDTPIIIKPNGDVSWQHVVNAFNAALRARYKNVAFTLVKQGS